MKNTPNSLTPIMKLKSTQTHPKLSIRIPTDSEAENGEDSGPPAPRPIPEGKNFFFAEHSFWRQEELRKRSLSPLREHSLPKP